MKRVFVYFVYLVCGVLGALGGFIGGFMFLIYLGLAFFNNYEALFSTRGTVILFASPIGGLAVGLLTAYLLIHKRFPWQTQEQKVEKLINKLQHKNQNIRQTVVVALTKIGTPEALKAVETFESGFVHPSDYSID